VKPRKPPKKTGTKLATGAKDIRLARLLPLYAAGMPHAQIARLTGTSLRTVQRYSADPEVKETLEALNQQAQATTVQALAAAREVAIGALLAVMGSDDASPDARVKAAVAILDRSGHGPTTRTEHSGRDGGPIELASRPMTIDEAKARYAELTARLVERGFLPTPVLPSGE
jgi:predicted ArsR family transcriptional regulator